MVKTSAATAQIRWCNRIPRRSAREECSNTTKARYLYIGVGPRSGGNRPVPGRRGWAADLYRWSDSWQRQLHQWDPAKRWWHQRSRSQRGARCLL